MKPYMAWHLLASYCSLKRKRNNITTENLFKKGLNFESDSSLSGIYPQMYGLSVAGEEIETLFRDNNFSVFV
jgi:hypothetical protein